MEPPVDAEIADLTLRSLCLPVRIRPSAPMTDDDLLHFCERNRSLRVEREPDGELSIMTPVGFRTTTMNQRICRFLGNWAEEDGRGICSGPDGGYLLADGSMRSPDAAWVDLQKVAQFSDEEQEKFLKLCPDFVIELRSPGDRIGALREKMEQWMAKGASLGWLIDPKSRTVTIYRPSEEPETLFDPTSVQGMGPVRGFELVMARVWGS
jgi:Uma2 family endonuclease